MKEGMEQPIKRPEEAVWAVGWLGRRALKCTQPLGRVRLLWLRIPSP